MTFLFAEIENYIRTLFEKNPIFMNVLITRWYAQKPLFINDTKRYLIGHVLWKFKKRGYNNKTLKRVIEQILNAYIIEHRKRLGLYNRLDSDIE